MYQIDRYTNKAAAELVYLLDVVYCRRERETCAEQQRAELLQHRTKQT